MNQEILAKFRRGIRTGVAVLIIGLFLWGFLLTVSSPSGQVPFEKWYGNWSGVANVTSVFLLFIFFLIRPRRPMEWGNAGLTTAFFISLFAEMFGIPLTIYLLVPLLGIEPQIFGMHESHLWAYLLSRVGITSIETAVYLVMVVSMALIAIGFSLLALGWKEVYRGKGDLVITGLYGRVRHPQYLGLILVIIAFLVQWPTLLTLLLAPLLAVRYIRLAHVEDEELAEKFGENFEQYKGRIAGFIPLLRQEFKR